MYLSRKFKLSLEFSKSIWHFNLLALILPKENTKHNLMIWTEMSIFHPLAVTGEGVGCIG